MALKVPKTNQSTLEISLVYFPKFSERIFAFKPLAKESKSFRSKKFNQIASKSAFPSHRSRMSESTTFTEEEMLLSKMRDGSQPEKASTDGQPALRLDWEFRSKIIQHLVDQSLWLGGSEEDKKRLQKANSDMILDLLDLPVLNQPVNSNVCETCSKMPEDLEGVCFGFQVESFKSGVSKLFVIKPIN